jgi:hypothetical protein
MDAKALFFLITSLVFPVLSIGVFICWLLVMRDAWKSQNASGAGTNKRTWSVAILLSLVRAIILALSIPFGVSIGGAIYAMPSNGFHLHYPFTSDGIIYAFSLGIYFPWLPVLIPTVLWAIVCLFPKSPWWSFLIPFVGYGLLAYGTLYLWYTA